jgi:hypothetical protein
LPKYLLNVALTIILILIVSSRKKMAVPQQNSVRIIPDPGVLYKKAK